MQVLKRFHGSLGYVIYKRHILKEIKHLRHCVLKCCDDLYCAERVDVLPTANPDKQ